MQLAATGLAGAVRAAIRDAIGSVSGVAGKRVLLLVGSGNNGGDALFAGAELAADGADVGIVPAASRLHKRGLAAAVNAGARIEPLDDLAALAARSDVIIDGLVGTGSSGSSALRGAAREVVAAILPALGEPRHPLVVAVDIPSGIDPDDGSVPDDLVLPADVTVTFGAYKAGLLLEPASALAGKVLLVDIGLGHQLEGVEPVLVIER